MDWIHRVLASPQIPVPEKGMDFTPIVGIAELRVVTRVLDRLGIKYALGGSIASGVYGYPRSTQDADLSVEAFQSKAQLLIDALGSDYYVSRQAIDEAHQRHSSFNILHTPTGFKIDLFVAAPSGFSQMILDRRTSHSFSDLTDEPISICTPEDVVLLKLQWYRLGNEVSDHQWNDIVGVVKTKRDQLDSAYLDQWANQLGVADLLARARQESGV
jgi:hypothetical protein